MCCNLVNYHCMISLKALDSKVVDLCLLLFMYQPFSPVPACSSVVIQLLRGITYKRVQRTASAWLQLQDVAHMISTVTAVKVKVGPWTSQQRNRRLMHYWRGWSRIRERLVCFRSFSGRTASASWSVLSNSPQTSVQIDRCWEFALSEYFTWRWSNCKVTWNAILKRGTTSFWNL